MTDSVKLEGQCLCGAVQVRVAPSEPHIGACHCGMCRRWGGGPALSLRLVPDPEIEGAEHIVRYSSSDWAERGFCRTCGTHLFYFYRPQSGYSFQAGLFGDLQGHDLAEEIFIDEKPDYYDFAGERERMTGAEVMAKAGVSGA
ncbi:GFA family protein [Sphingomonas sp. NPDC092331]|uniref:GFA family protein n=1 Tax=unclassified Sphingomonas TaxID=196159 RepID=UPI0031F5C4DE